VIEPPLRRREGCDRGIAFRLQEHLKIVRSGFGVGQRQAADRLAVAAHHRPVADHLVHRFRQRAGSGQILQDVDALTLPQALENSAFDLGEVDDRLARGILQPHDVQPLDAPGHDILGEGQRRGAAGLELKLEALRAGIALQRDDTGLAALGGRQFPLPDHVLFQGRGILRPDLRSADRERNGCHGKRDTGTNHIQRALAGVSATGVSGGLPANHAFRLSTTS
jgi:hypothetical protein